MLSTVCYRLSVFDFDVCHSYRVSCIFLYVQITAISAWGKEEKKTTKIREKQSKLQFLEEKCYAVLCTLIRSIEFPSKWDVSCNSTYIRMLMVLYSCSSCDPFFTCNTKENPGKCQIKIALSESLQKKERFTSMPNEDGERLKKSLLQVGKAKCSKSETNGEAKNNEHLFSGANKYTGQE